MSSIPRLVSTFHNLKAEMSMIQSQTDQAFLDQNRDNFDRLNQTLHRACETLVLPQFKAFDSGISELFKKLVSVSADTLVEETLAIAQAHSTNITALAHAVGKLDVTKHLKKLADDKDVEAFKVMANNAKEFALKLSPLGGILYHDRIAVSLSVPLETDDFVAICKIVSEFPSTDAVNALFVFNGTCIDDPKAPSSWMEVLQEFHRACASFLSMQLRGVTKKEQFRVLLAVALQFKASGSTCEKQLIADAVFHTKTNFMNITEETIMSMDSRLKQVFKIMEGLPPEIVYDCFKESAELESKYDVEKVLGIFPVIGSIGLLLHGILKGELRLKEMKRRIAETDLATFLTEYEAIVEMSSDRIRALQSDWRLVHDITCEAGIASPTVFAEPELAQPDGEELFSELFSEETQDSITHEGRDEDSAIKPAHSSAASADRGAGLRAVPERVEPVERLEPAAKKARTEEPLQQRVIISKRVQADPTRTLDKVHKEYFAEGCKAFLIAKFQVVAQAMKDSLIEMNSGYLSEATSALPDPAWRIAVVDSLAVQGASMEAGPWKKMRAQVSPMTDLWAGHKRARNFSDALTKGPLTVFGWTFQDLLSEMDAEGVYTHATKLIGTCCMQQAVSKKLKDGQTRNGVILAAQKCFVDAEVEMDKVVETFMNDALVADEATADATI